MHVHLQQKGTESPGQRLTFDLGHEAQASFEVGADSMKAPPELGVAAVLIGAADVVAQVQLVAALCHGWDSYIELGNQGDAGLHTPGQKEVSTVSMGVELVD